MIKARPLGEFHNARAYADDSIAARCGGHCPSWKTSWAALSFWSSP